MATYRYMLVDVFTDTPLAGNQLGVFSNATGMSDELMQRLAIELGYAETTFVLPAEQGGDVRIRIFTTAQEIPFAGHPTLGTAFALAGPLQKTLIRIETGMGVVPVMMQREGARLVFGSMQQPVPTVCESEADCEELCEALGVKANVLPVGVYDNGLRHTVVLVGSFAEVAEVKPDMAWLAECCGDATISVAALEDGRVKTRVFVPGLGADEDAATGSAAGPLAVHLARHGLIEWGAEIEISQGAEIGRPSTLYATARGSAEAIESVEVGGSAVVVARGEFKV